MNLLDIFNAKNQSPSYFNHEGHTYGDRRFKAGGSYLDRKYSDSVTFIKVRPDDKTIADIWDDTEIL